MTIHSYRSIQKITRIMKFLPICLTKPRLSYMLFHCWYCSTILVKTAGTQSGRKVDQFGSSFLNYLKMLNVVGFVAKFELNRILVTVVIKMNILTFCHLKTKKRVFPLFFLLMTTFHRTFIKFYQIFTSKESIILFFCLF